jgi:3-deoxy-D-manno-octulosonate 8-phosphate phosphatase (KDO 8-P phosphatase)
VPAKPKTPARAARIRLLVLDVDGVLTDGALVYGPSGEETKRFHVRDGLAMQLARNSGIEIAVVSGRASAAVTRRMSELGIVEVHQGVADKAGELRALLDRLRVGAHETAVMGDDLPDLPVMKMAGLALAPSDAAPETKRAAAWVAATPGGRGAVREAVEMLLRARRAWPPRK